MSETRPRDAVLVATVLTAASAAVGGVLVALSNQTGLAVVLGVLCTVLVVRMAPKRLAVAGVIAMLLARSIEIATGWAPTTYIDEIVTVYLVLALVGRRLLERRPLRRPPGIWAFAGFAVAGVLSSIVSDVPLGIAAAGGVLAVKGVLMYLAVAQVDWTRDDIPWLTRTGVWVLGVALACALVNLVLPGPWSAVFSVTGYSQYRTFLPSLVGPFTHPLQFGNFMSLAAIACVTPLLYWAQASRGARKARGLFVAAVIAAVLSFRRTATVGLLAALSFLALRRKNASMLLTAALVLPIVAIVLFPVLHQVAVATYDSFIVEGTDNARTRMTIDSITLAFQHFPFGVGFGRFGSAIAREQYSIEYVRLGYDSVYGLGSPTNPNNHGRFLTDTQWPAIVGETGLVGALLFVTGLWRVVATFRRASRVGDLPLRLLGLTGVGWSIHILLESVAYPVFVNAPTYPLLFGLAAVTAVIMSASGPTGSGGPEGAEPSPAAADTAAADVAGTDVPFEGGRSARAHRGAAARVGPVTRRTSSTDRP